MPTPHRDDDPVPGESDEVLEPVAPQSVIPIRSAPLTASRTAATVAGVVGQQTDGDGPNYERDNHG